MVKAQLWLHTLQLAVHDASDRVRMLQCTLVGDETKKARVCLVCVVCMCFILS